MKNIRRVRLALCLVVLHLTAVSSVLPSIIVRDGQDVTLPSGHEMGDPFTCDGVDWLKGSPHPKNVVTHGQVNSQRLDLTANCSLVIKRVTSQDVGIYHFQLTRTGEDVQFYLSVLKLSYHEEQEVVTLTCSAPAPDLYRHTVTWVYEGAEKPGAEVPGGALYSNTVTFPRASVKQGSAYLDLYKCKVTDGYTHMEHLFGFRPQSTKQEPGEDKIKAQTTEPTMKPTTTTERGGLTKTTLEDWWIIIVAAGVSVVIVIIVVLIIRWRRTTGRKTKGTDSTELSLNPTAPPQSATETSPDTEDPEADVSYAAVSYTKKKRGTTAQTQNRPDDSDTVTYSTLKASSSPPAAAPSPIYATVRKTTDRPESSY